MLSNYIIVENMRGLFSSLSDSVEPGDIVVNELHDCSYHAFQVDSIDEHGNYIDYRGTKHYSGSYRKATPEEIKDLGFYD